MITTNKCVLKTKSERMLEMLVRFEAIELISDACEVEKIWSFNKTPIVFGTFEGGIEVSENNNGLDFEKEFTSWAYKIGIEPGEMCTGKSYDTRKDSCILCAIGRYKGGTTDAGTYNATVENEVDCIIYESPNFYVTSELGALKRGFLMIVPKAHILSVAQFPLQLRHEYQDVCEDVECILGASFGSVAPVVFFEHGSGPSGITSHPKSIVHAHTHVLHGFAMRKSDLDRVQCKPIDNISKAAETHYFSYQCGARGQLYCCYNDLVYVPRQYARQVIARDLGYPPGQFNWRKNTFCENVHQTLYAIWRTLKHTDLGSRILQRSQCFIDGYASREDFCEH